MVGSRSGRRHVAILLTLVLGVSACDQITLSGARARRSPPATRPAAPPSLDHAQFAFFGNRYQEAEEQYRAFLAANPRSAEGHADYALFLNYGHRFPEALGESETAVHLAPGSALAHAVDTRVHDWAARDRTAIKAAVKLGADAVRLGPRSALAHAFYSETLADSGAAKEAQRELDLATPLATTGYEKGEVEREKANLAGDADDRAGQLTHLKAAQALEPSWVERVRELAQFYFAEGRHGEAVAAFRQAISLAPKDANLRINLGALALSGQDLDLALASEAFDAADQLKPHDPAVEAILAMSHFTLRHDAADAETLLRRAAADAPDDIDAAELLEGFLRYVKGDATAADQVTMGRLPREPLSPRAAFPTPVRELRRADQEAALKALNDYRAKAHLTAVHLDDRISAGALSHDYWWLFNLSLPQVKGLGIHREAPGTAGFSGYTMRDRASHFGYPSAPMAEDITHAGEPVAAIAQWVDSVYHRFPIMRPDLDAVGFGSAIGGDIPIETLDLGYRVESGVERQMVEYPADGQTDVPSVFTDNELPDPIPPAGAKPSGYPITVNFNPYVSVSIGTAEVRDAGGSLVDRYLIPPSRSDENVVTLLPKQPMKKSSLYRVHLTGTINGAGFTQDWSFTTES